MPIQPGERLLHYRLVEKIGEGGMGVVWKAADTTLEREVAIKFLPESLAQDTERLARFEREAKLLASLNHTNIAAIYGLHESSELRFLAMELIPGEELSARLKRGALSVAQALLVCRQIALALEAAHERGVIHRDLKPANVKITPDDRVKVLDFGLAKAFETSPGHTSLSMSPTMTSAGTRAGMILGTAAYMSPEQARGQTVDKRADVWAFGCVLFECLTGRQAFGGNTVSDVLASILKTEPDWSALKGRCSARTVVLLKRCLEKDAGKRLRDFGDVGIELDGLLAGDRTADDDDTGRRASWRAVGVAAAAGLLLGAVLTAGWSLRGTAPQPAEVLRASILLPLGTELDTSNRSLSLSPDGRVPAHAGKDSSGATGIWVRRLDSLGPQFLSGTEGASYPFWSPDGRHLGFLADGKLRKIPATGGTPVTVCDASDGRGASWGVGDVIVFSPRAFGPLYKVAAGGGTPVAATREERIGYTHRNPHFLPDGKHVLFYQGKGSDAGEDDGIYILDLASGETSRVVAERSEGLFVEPGYLAYVRERNLMVQPFDRKTLRISGEPIPLAEDVQFNTFRCTGSFAFANGLLLYREGALQSESQLTWFDLDGKDLGKLGEAAVFWLQFAVAPDGRRVMTDIRRSDGKADLWIYDLERGLGSPFTFSGGEPALRPVWSPDGSQVAFGNGSGKILTKAADGQTSAKTLYDLGNIGFADDWSPDGSHLLVSTQVGDLGRELVLYPADGDGEPRPIASSPADEGPGAFSPDGKWLAMHSNASGREELYVHAFPEVGGKWQISTSGVVHDEWLPDGSGLIYSTPDQRLLRVSITASATGLVVGAPQELFGGNFGDVGASIWTLAADGKRLLVAVPVKSETAPVLTLVSHWAEALQ